MDLLSKILMSIDAIKTQLLSSAKKNAEDYYNVISAVDEDTLKLNNGTMVSCFELRGFSYILNEQEKIDICAKIERSLDGFFLKSGYSIQIVDYSDPEMTEFFAKESMQPSIDEMKAMGISHSMLTTDYLEFITKKAVWRKQFFVVTTSVEALASNKHKFNKKSKEEIKKENLDSSFTENVLKEDANSQAVFLNSKDKAVLFYHQIFYNYIFEQVSKHGIILKKMDASDVVKSQRMTIYGKDSSPEWTPDFSSMAIAKDGEDSTNAGRVKLKTPSMSEQVLFLGGTEQDLPPEVFRFGNRVFTTLSMTMPQRNQELMASYESILGKIPNHLGFIVSYKIISNPFGDKGYQSEQIYTGMSAALPGTNNLLIRRARSELKSRHDNKRNTGVYMQTSITLFSNSVEELVLNRQSLLSILDSNNGSVFRTVEQDKTQGLFESVPGVTKKASLTNVIENLRDALFQTPIFTPGVLYESGYFHFLTEYNQPFPFEEHSARNINYNVYITGTPGSGKSTLLTVLNLALLSKPKTNPRLKGEIPLSVDIDFGKTSFGFKETIRDLVDDSKKHLFLLHEFSTKTSSAVNPHDLTLGRRIVNERHKEILTRFMLVLIAGVEKEKDGGFKIKHVELESMIKYLIDSVYKYRFEENDPHLFDPAEFRHEGTMAYLEKIGIKPNKHHSYYFLADEVMKKDPKKGKNHAILLQRYGVPRLTDYSQLINDNPELCSRFEKGVVSGNKSPKDFFLERLGDVMSEFPCFTRVTAINFDMARMISLDIKTVCGESDYRKAVFGSLCLMMYQVKRDNAEESDDYFEGVAPQYQSYLKRQDLVNRILPGTLNIEEAHVLYKLFDDILTSMQRHNRKAGWGIRSLSQRLIDPGDNFFSTCSTVFLTSPEVASQSKEGQLLDSRLSAMETTIEERNSIANNLHDRIAFVYIKTKPGAEINVKRVASLVRVSVSPAILWVSNSEQVDRDFRKAVIDNLGKEAGYDRIGKFYFRGSVRGYLTNPKIKRLANQRGEDSVFSLLLNEISKNEKPSSELARLL